MKLQHHLGGLENLGPVNLETRVFVEDWEKRIFGIHTAMVAESAHLSDALARYPVKDLPTTFRNDWTWASLRTGAEDMQPFEYFKFRYYEKWLGGISQFFIDQGYITSDELNEKIGYYRSNPDAELPTKPNEDIGKQIDAYLKQGDSGYHPLAAPTRRFAPGRPPGRLRPDHLGGSLGAGTQCPESGGDVGRQPLMNAVQIR